MRSIVFALACWWVAPVIAPPGDPTGAILRRLGADTGTSQGGRTHSFGACAAAAATALVAAAAATSNLRRSDAVFASNMCALNRTHVSKPGSSVEKVDLCSSSDEEGSEVDWNASMDVEEETLSALSDEDEELQVHVRKKDSSSGKLWSKSQFPEGVVGSANWDVANLRSAQQWECPCVDRANCIGEDRISILDLYEYRKKFRTSAAVHGGLRDAARQELEHHYDAVTGQFNRGFKVGKLVDCCAASAGLAKGLSFATWSASRADCTRARPLREGRKQVRAVTQSRERAHLEAYIRAVREEMEGPKGGYEVHDKWHTGKVPISRRWEQYKKSRFQKKLPVIGSESLFTKLWSQHGEIREHAAKGHAKCDRCAISTCALVHVLSTCSHVSLVVCIGAVTSPRNAQSMRIAKTLLLESTCAGWTRQGRSTTQITLASVLMQRTPGLKAKSFLTASQLRAWTRRRNISSTYLCSSVRRMILSKHSMVQKSGHPRSWASWLQAGVCWPSSHETVLDQERTSRAQCCSSLSLRWSELGDSSVRASTFS